MKTLASAVVALPVLAGIASQASAQSYGYSAPVPTHTTTKDK